MIEDRSAGRVRVLREPPGQRRRVIARPSSPADSVGQQIRGAMRKAQSLRRENRLEPRARARISSAIAIHKACGRVFRTPASGADPLKPVAGES